MLINMFDPTRRVKTISPPGDWYRIPLVIVALLWLTVAVACSRNTELTGILPIEAPALANAGEKIAVTVGPVPDATNGTSVGLVMLGTYGPRVYQSEFESGLALFTIPASHTLQPGYLALIAAADNARGEASIILFSTSTTTIDYHEAPASPRSGTTSQISTQQP